MTYADQCTTAGEGREDDDLDALMASFTRAPKPKKPLVTNIPGTPERSCAECRTQEHATGRFLPALMKNAEKCREAGHRVTVGVVTE